MRSNCSAPHPFALPVKGWETTTRTGSMNRNTADDASLAWYPAFEILSRIRIPLALVSCHCRIRTQRPRQTHPFGPALGIPADSPRCDNRLRSHSLRDPAIESQENVVFGIIRI
jgi:hypothetical protein